MKNGIRFCLMGVLSLVTELIYASNSVLTTSSGSWYSKIHPFVGIEALEESSNFDMTFNDFSGATSDINAIGAGVGSYIGLKFIPENNLRLSIMASYQAINNETGTSSFQVSPSMSFQKKTSYSFSVLPGYAFDAFELYGKLGIETTNVIYNNSANATLNYNTWANAAQIGVGSLYNFTPHVGIRFEYTYSKFNNIHFNGSNGSLVDNENLQLRSYLASLGLEWTF